MTLLCTYWGSDTGTREFDILVDGDKIAMQKLDRNKPGEFFDVSYAVPEQLTHGKERVTVRFQAHPGNMAGGLFGLRVLKPRVRAGGGGKGKRWWSRSEALAARVELDGEPFGAP